MSSVQFREMLVALFNEAPIKKSLDLSLEYNDQAEAMCKFPRNSNFDHGGGDVHGGIIATLLDTAAWFTAAAQYGQAVVTADINVRMLRPARQGDLVATAQVIRLGSKAAVTQMQVSGADGELVAVGTASLTKIGSVPSK